VIEALKQEAGRAGPACFYVLDREGGNRQIKKLNQKNGMMPLNTTQTKRTLEKNFENKKEHDR
jgi:hypothetical protein